MKTWARRAFTPRVLDVIEDGFILTWPEIGASAKTEEEFGHLVVARRDWRSCRDGALAVAVGSVIWFRPGQLEILGPDQWHLFGFSYKEETPLMGALDAKLHRMLSRPQLRSRLPSMTRCGLPWEIVLIADQDAQREAARAFIENSV